MDAMLSKEMNVASGLVGFGRDGLVFHRTPTWEEWEQVMMFLKAARSVSLRWMADARVVGRRAFGDEAVVAFEEQLDLDLPDLKASIALEGLECRSQELSDEHHFVVAQRVKGADEQRTWLETAKREGLTAVELRSSIASGRVVRTVERAGRGGGMASMEGVRQLFDLWAKQVPAEEWKGWPEDRKRRLLETILPMVEMGDFLRAELGDVIKS